MTTVVITNKSQGLRAFRNIDGRSFTLSPGDTRTIEMHPHHVFQLEREAMKEDATVGIEIPPAERDEYSQMVAAIKKGNAAAQRITRATRMPVLERMPAKDTRYLTDPRTVEPEVKGPDFADPPKKPKKNYTIRPKANAADSKDETPPITVDTPPPPKKPKTERVVLKETV